MSKYLEIPTMWEELTAEQFTYLLRLVFEAKPDEVTMGDVLLKYADFLIGERQFIAPDKRSHYYKLVSDVAETLDWIFAQDEDGNFVLDFCTTQNLLPTIKRFLGPQSHGSDLTFGEYRMAIDMMNRYATEKETFFLDALCGVLYREPSVETDTPSFDGNFRKKFNKHHVERYARNFEKSPEYLKWGIYLWFAYFNQYLIDGGEFIIDGNTLSFEALFERSSGAEDDQTKSIGMMSIVFTLADNGTFGDAEKTDETLLFPVLMKLLHDKQMIDKLKKNDRN